MSPSTPETPSPETPAEPISEAAKEATQHYIPSQAWQALSDEQKNAAALPIQRAITAARGQDVQRIAEQDERISWLETQREVEARQKEAAFAESGECLKESAALRNQVAELTRERNQWKKRVLTDFMAGVCIELHAECDTLRTALAEAQEQAQTARREAEEDTADLDWLDTTGHFEDFHRYVINNYRPFKQTPLRQAIAAARHAAGTTKEAK